MNQQFAALKQSLFENTNSLLSEQCFTLSEIKKNNPTIVDCLNWRKFYRTFTTLAFMSFAIRSTMHFLKQN